MSEMNDLFTHISQTKSFAVLTSIFVYMKLILNDGIYISSSHPFLTEVMTNDKDIRLYFLPLSKIGHLHYNLDVTIITNLSGDL